MLLGADAGTELKVTDKKDDLSSISNPVAVIGLG